MSIHSHLKADNLTDFIIGLGEEGGKKKENFSV